MIVAGRQKQPQAETGQERHHRKRGAGKIHGNRAPLAVHLYGDRTAAADGPGQGAGDDPLQIYRVQGVAGGDHRLVV